MVDKDNEGWRRVCKDIALVAGAIAACGAAGGVFYYIGTFLLPYVRWIFLATILLVMGSGLLTSLFMSERSSSAHLARLLMSFWVIVPMAIIFTLFDSITSATPVPHTSVVVIGVIMVVVYSLVFIFTLRRQTESDMRIAIIEKALTLTGTDLEQTSQAYVKETINTHSTLGRALMRAWGPHKYRPYIAP